MINVKKKNILNILLPLACIFCNISQLPFLWGNGTVSLVYQGLFVFILLYSLIKSRLEITLPYLFITIAVFFILFLFVASSINDGSYFGSNLLFPILLSGFVLITSFEAGQLLEDESVILSIVYSYVISAGVLGIFIFINYFQGVDWLNATGYIYTAKNSTAVIFMTAIVLIYYFIMPKYKWMAFLSIAIFSTIIFMLKSRATVLMWCIFFVYALCINRTNNYKRFVGVIICVTVALFVIYVPKLNDIFIKNIILNNRTTDLETLTSGRDAHYKFFNQNFGKVWLIGNGGMYLESFPLANLYSYGIIGGIPVFLLSIYPTIEILKNKSKSPIKYKRIVTVIFVLNILLWINGIFEELAPFGPGVKCYMVWMLTGLYLGMLKRKVIKDEK